MDDEDDEPVDALMEEFDTYEDYLDKQITPTDLYYLEDVELARQLVELGYRGNGELLRRDEFDVRKQNEVLAEYESGRLDECSRLRKAFEELQEMLVTSAHESNARVHAVSFCAR